MEVPGAEVEAGKSDEESYRGLATNLNAPGPARKFIWNLAEKSDFECDGASPDLPEESRQEYREPGWILRMHRGTTYTAVKCRKLSGGLRVACALRNLSCG